VTIDADLRTTAEIPRLLAKLDEGSTSSAAGRRTAATRSRARVPSKIFNWVTGRVSVAACTTQLRVEGLPEGSCKGCGCTASSTASSRARALPRLPDRRAPSQPPAARHGRSRYGVERYVRGFLDLLTVSFIGRYRYRPLHLFGGLGLARRGRLRHSCT
jgi:dolichol-phosphate mannosyltransferase